MTRLFSIIKKNLLLLFRHKRSAFVILFGPLLVVALVGLAFNSPSSQKLVVGTFSVDSSPLVDRFVDTMRSDGLIVETFSSLDPCVTSVKDGALQACVVFPANFSVEDDSPDTITFYVDESRSNFVYQIIDVVSSSVGVESSRVSEDLAERLLGVLFDSRDVVSDSIGDIVKLKASVSQIDSDVDSSIDSLKGLSFDSVSVDLDPVSDSFDSLDSSFKNLISEAQSLVDEGQSLVSALNSDGYNGSADVSGFSSSLSSLESLLSQKSSERSNFSDDFEAALDSVLSSIDDLNDQLSSSKEASDEVISLLEDVRSSTSKVLSDLDSLKSSLESVKSDIDSLKVTSGEAISRPIITDIKPVSGKNNRLLFMFPYLLMLVVLFVGLLLSSTFIVMEKSSKAAFRTFTAPTSDNLFLFAHFLSSFFVLFLQVFIVLAVASFFTDNLLLNNVVPSLVILLSSIVMFIIFGMGIGYLFNTQESVTIVSISIGSLFIFLSNLVLPVETLSEGLREVVNYNPYIIASESFRKTLLFGAPLSQLINNLLIVLGYSVAIILLIVLVKDLVKSRYFLQSAFRHRRVVEKPSDAYLRLGDSDIKDLHDLLSWLKSVDDKTFKKLLHWKDLREWLVHERYPGWLRVRLAGKSRKQMIRVLEKHLKSGNDES